MPDQLYQVTSPYFCAGLVTKGGQIVMAAPILRWAIGRTIGYMQNYCQRKGWQIVEVK